MTPGRAALAYLGACLIGAGIGVRVGRIDNDVLRRGFIVLNVGIVLYCVPKALGLI